MGCGQSAVFLALVLDIAAFLWLGLYALARGDHEPIAVLRGR